jgi:hypothetical protein
MWYKLLQRPFTWKKAAASALPSRLSRLQTLATSRIKIPEISLDDLGIGPMPSSDFRDVDECERMFVTALVSTDLEAITRLRKHLISLPISQLHPDTFGNLLVSFKNDPISVLSLGASHALEAWVSTWEAPEVEGWTGGVGGRASAVSSFLQAASTMLRPGTPSVMALGALCCVLDFYGYLLAAHSAGNLPRPLAVVSVEDLALLHNDIKYWRWFTAESPDEDAGEEHPEDVLLHLCVTQVMAAAKRESSKPQPSLALLALLEPRLINNRVESDLQAFLRIFRSDVLMLRTPDVAHRDVHLLLSSFCPPWQLQKYSGNVAALNKHSVVEKLWEKNASGIKRQQDWHDNNKLSQNMRFSAARSLFLWCVSQTNTSYLLSSESLEVVFRIAGATADKQLLKSVLEQFAHLSPRLSPNAYRRVVSAAFHCLRDWISDSTPGPTASATTATEYFPTIGRDATSVCDNHARTVLFSRVYCISQSRSLPSPSRSTNAFLSFKLHFPSLLSLFLPHFSARLSGGLKHIVKSWSFSLHCPSVRTVAASRILETELAVYLHPSLRQHCAKATPHIHGRTAWNFWKLGFVLVEVRESSRLACCKYISSRSNDSRIFNHQNSMQKHILLLALSCHFCPRLTSIWSSASTLPLLSFI